MIDKEQVIELTEKIESLEKIVGPKIGQKLKLKEAKRLADHLYSFSRDCEECEIYLEELREKTFDYYNEHDYSNKEYIGEYRSYIETISKHLQSDHDMVPEGHYMSLYMSLGMSIGVIFGLTIFDNIALGIPIGMGIGIAIGSGLDEDAKKKGKTI